MGPCWGCPRGKEGPIHQSLGNGLVLPLLSFQRMYALSGILAQKVSASSGCHKCRIVHSLWLENWAADQTGPQTQVFPFHFKGSQLRGLKSGLMATLRVMVRGAKVNDIDRSQCLQNNFPILKQLLSDCQSDSEERGAGVTLSCKVVCSNNMK